MNVKKTADITTESTMADVLGAYPGARRALFRRYHIGGCGSCGFAVEEPLGQVLQRHGVASADEVIEHIKASHEQELAIQIGPRELAEWLEEPDAPRLIDVREPAEQAMAKIDGALPATGELVEEMKSSWPRETPIVVYCHRGLRSLDAASYLIGHGFTNVRSLTGGIDAWAREVDSSMAKYGE